MKFQINLRLDDVDNMAHVEKFSHLTIPMLWFDIVSSLSFIQSFDNSINKNQLQVMYELPPVLKNRFHLYLNVLPFVDTLSFYGLFVGGIFMLILAISKVSFNMSLSLSSVSRNISKQKYNQKGDQYKTNVYMPCEEKLIPGDDMEKCSEYLSEKSCTEMQNMDLKMSYELENELPLIESETDSESGSEEPNTDDTDLEKRKQHENKVR